MNVTREAWPQREKAQRRQGRTIAVFQAIRRQLLNDEPVERLVFIERLDHIITIRPRPVKIFLLKKNVPLVVRIPRHIQPSPCPMLAVARRIEERF